MATVTGLTAARMLDIEAASVVEGEVIGDNLILTKHDGSTIDSGNVRGPAGPTGPAGSGWETGDYKMSAQISDHVDSIGGIWYLCDGRVSPDPALTALIGANLPDGRGRSLVMQGTHADVNAIGDNDGEATVANRRPTHKHTVVQPSISRPGITVVGPTIGLIADYSGSGGGNHYVPTPPGTAETLGGGSASLNSDPVASGGTVGPQTAGTPADRGSFVVPGNLFIYLTL